MRITVNFDVDAKTHTEAWLIVNRIFASLSLPEKIKQITFEKEK